MRDRANRQQLSPVSLIIAAIVGINVGNCINSQNGNLLTWLEMNKGNIAGALVLYSFIMSFLGFLSWINERSNQNGYYAKRPPMYFMGAILGIIASIVVLNINFQL